MFQSGMVPKVNRFCENWLIVKDNIQVTFEEAQYGFMDFFRILCEYSRFTQVLLLKIFQFFCNSQKIIQTVIYIYFLKIGQLIMSYVLVWKCL